MSDDSQDSCDSELSKKFTEQLSLGTGDQQVVAKGKNRVQQAQRVSAAPCQDATRARLKQILHQRKPTDFTVDSDTLDTPIHRFLESQENRGSRGGGVDLVELLSQLLSDLSTLGYLSVYVNMPNKFGRTPLSLCLRTDDFADLIGPLVRHGAQMHHLCGNLTERCNHLHYVMLKGTPNIIHKTLDEVFRCDPFGADGMCAMNRNRETPKAALQRRIRESWDQPELQRELSDIIRRIPGYPPIDGVPLFAD